MFSRIGCRAGRSISEGTDHRDLQSPCRTLSIRSLNVLTKSTISSHKLTQSLTLTCSVSVSKGVDSTVAAKLMAVLNTTKLTSVRFVAVVWLNTKHNYV